MSFRHLRAAAVACLLGGCTGDGADRGLPANAVDADALPELAVDEELRIGSVDDPEEGLSRVGGVTVAHDGRVLVLEAMDRQVRVYTPEGRLERTIGRRGDGPGEFQGPLRFGLLSDTLWVADFGNERITFLDLEGRTLATLRADPVPVDVGIDGIRGWAHPARLRPDGLVATEWRMSSRPDVEADSIAWPDLLLDREGSVVDTIRVHRHPWPPSPLARVNGFSLGVAPPLPDHPLHADSGSDRITLERPAATEGGPAAFTLLRVAPSGDTLLRRNFAYRPRPVTPQWREKRIAEIVSWHQERPGAPSAGVLEQAVREVLRFPKHHPPVAEMHVGGEGRVWLRRDEDDTARHRWIVVLPDGTPRGLVRLAREAEVTWARGDQVWIVERDEFDVPWLVRLRISDP